jgi:mRNA interferase MazF
MTSFRRGDVVVVDLGIAAKVRPAVVVSITNPDSQRTGMAVVVPMTTEIRKGECEISFSKPPWLKQTCVVNLLGIAGVDRSRIERVIGTFPIKPMEEIDRGLARLLGLQGSP